MYIEEEAWNAYPKCKTGSYLLLCAYLSILITLKWVYEPWLLAFLSVSQKHVQCLSCSTIVQLFTTFLSRYIVEFLPTANQVCSILRHYVRF